MTNEQFLEELAKSKGLVFFPRDMDVGSRITVETKLLGGETILNDNVLPKFEPWFYKPLNEIEAYFLEGPSRFLKIIENNLCCFVASDKSIVSLKNYFSNVVTSCYLRN